MAPKNKRAASRPLLDAVSNASLAELHRKERRLLRTQHGLLHTHHPPCMLTIPQPPSPNHHRLLQHHIQHNPHLKQLLQRHEEQQRATQSTVTNPPPPLPPSTDALEPISRALWAATPGYVKPPTRYASMISTSIGVFDEEERRILSEYGEYSNTMFHRQRDEFSSIADHMLRMKHLDHSKKHPVG